jgi:inositol phosphorylceramide mannosyltransferase catalytic subunit
MPNNEEWHEIAPTLAGDATARTKQKIPFDIYQTFKTNRVPAPMFRAIRSWIENNSEYTYHFYDDDRLFDYVEHDFPCEEFSFTPETLLRAMRTIGPGAGKADLFRYLIIYDRGGVYMDIDTVCLKPLRDYLLAEDEAVTGIGRRGDFHQWGLIYVARHPFMKQTIENTVANIVNRRFVSGYDSLEGIGGPPCLDASIKQVLGMPPFLMFVPGDYRITCDGKPYRYRIMDGDFFGNNVDFKYREYADDLKKMDVPYWQNVRLFNDD